MAEMATQRGEKLDKLSGDLEGSSLSWRQFSSKRQRSWISKAWDSLPSVRAVQA